MQRVLAILLTWVFFSLILTNFHLCNAQRATINVVVNSRQPIPNGETIFAEGSFSVHNPFYEDKIQLIPASDGSYIYSFIFKQGANVDFKFTRGKENSQEVNAQKQEVPQRILKAEQPFQTQYFTIEKWKDLTSKPYQAPVITEVGEKADLIEPDRLRIHKQLKSGGLSERDVYVWLPPNYHIDSYKRYPVIYIHQNHAVFNPSFNDFNNDWQIDEIADNFSTSNKEIILVSIDNRNDQSFAVDDASVIEPYLHFMTQQVKPLIDSSYRTSTKANETYNLGAMMGGCMAFVLSAKYPTKFGKAICISPTVYFPEDYKHIATYINKYSNNKAIFTIQGGTTNKEARYVANAKSLYNHLLEKGFSATWLTETDGEFSPVIWSNRIRDLLANMP